MREVILKACTMVIFISCLFFEESLPALAFSNYSIEDIGSSSPSSINNLGHVTGFSYTTGDTSLHAFLYRSGAMTDLGTLVGEANSYGFGINDSDQVVGNSGGAFLWTEGNMTGLENLGHVFCEGNDINNFSQIAGACYNSDGNEHAVMWNNGSISDLGTLDNMSFSIATSINNAGKIVGYSYSPGGCLRTFVYQEGKHDRYWCSSWPAANCPFLYK